MAKDPASTYIYHITDVSNLPAILASEGLRSDASLLVANVQPTVIGHDHIKQRRLTQLTIPCCDGRYVGEFVPFYFCPRSPMLYTINMGNTGRPVGCQKSIVHLVTTVAVGMGLGRDWAISDGNAGASYTSFTKNPASLDDLDWEIINSNTWGGDERRNKKASEFLLADLFPLTSVIWIGCQNETVANQVSVLFEGRQHKPAVIVRPHWYY